MSETPEVSVVMGVYNGASQLRETIDSILSQENVSLEFIIINDGSTDESPQILLEYAERDSRIRIIEQANQGLTIALKRGCAVSRGVYIARQDVGDVSLSGKLANQVRFIKDNPDAALASCGTRFIGPRGEHLYDVKQESCGATERLLTLEPSELRGPSSHSSAIFPRAFYERVGGYRSAFYFAQDLDLWVRLAEQGRHIVIPEILYQASVTLGTISGLYRKEQVALTHFITESARLRRSGLSDERVLRKAATIRPHAKRKTSRLARARALYFIGSCLRKRKDPQATAYLKQALQAWPFHLRSAVKLLFD
jgi:glycosyltransferase involved in cell wall biosynthesis